MKNNFEENNFVRKRLVKLNERLFRSFKNCLKVNYKELDFLTDYLSDDHLRQLVLSNKSHDC